LAGVAGAVMVVITLLALMNHSGKLEPSMKVVKDLGEKGRQPEVTS
jgi:hypothetical protein